MTRKILLTGFVLLLVVVVGHRMTAAAQVDMNSGSVVVSAPENFSRVVAVSDAHGMYDPLVTLLKAANLIDGNLNWAAKDTLLIVVGDSIDKGPNSVGILDLWISLTDQAARNGGRLIHLLGNHEAEFLASPGNDHKAKELISELAAKNISVNELTDPNFPRGKFLRSQPLVAAVGKWLFFHAGLFPDMTWAKFQETASALMTNGSYGDPLLSDANSLLEARTWWPDPAQRSALEKRIMQEGFFGIVFGHQPEAFNMPGRIGAIDDGRLIKIDNGMASQAGGNPGSVLVFEQPAEMKLAQFPHVSVIGADGKSSVLSPETVPVLTSPLLVEEED